MSSTSTDGRLVPILVAVLAALVVLVFLPLLFVGTGTMGFGSMGPGMMGTAQGGMWADGGALPGWTFVVGVVLQLLFLAVVAGGVYLAYRAVTDRDDEDPALAELRVAYARGDLTDDEYERRRDVLERD